MLEYTLGSNKGASKQGDVVNSVFGLGTFRNGEPTAFDTKYTSAQVSETTAVASSTTVFPMKWTPVIPGTVQVAVDSTQYVDDGEGHLLALTTVAESISRVVNPDGSVSVAVTYAPSKSVADAAGTIVYTGAQAGITFKSAITSGTVTVNYAYNNVVIPQNDLPTLNVEMKSMPLIAKARRIAVYYSQIAAFQAKTDYGFDLGDQLAEKAVGELAYEIDTEIVELLDTTAGTALSTFDATRPQYISLAEHYEGFAREITKLSTAIYDRTKRFAPNYMVVSSALLQIFAFLKGWVAAPAGVRNGPYFAGTYNGIKVFVSPALASGRYFLGVNGDDMMSSAAVYAPYMPIVPTQLLGFADGGMTQGWSTLYDLKVLNPNLLVAGAVTNL